MFCFLFGEIKLLNNIIIAKLKKQKKMRNSVERTKSLFGLWAILGIALGLSFGIAVNNALVGVVLGLVACMWMGLVTDRTAKGISKLVK